ncbi:MAG: hypothetical protein A2W18_08540 [Candidatus Muproteobacteria bacterium RBG_16_60_9]|uniref:Uncharacterized protein n=1 Tax=Candidatus Muproteobacteria bacterium RBG_16_60_9 TaxID=1817755 RepID=A0A1F6VGY2_9PROT|nr:MAG: hypothetical protein A2W18_08540 [Candidatus Muproteobacteria bacterium RBG_16_60_9]
MQSPGGVFLGDTHGLQINLKRFGATAERIVKGLYSEFFETRLPETHAVSVFFTELQKDSSAIDRTEVKELLGFLKNAQLHRRGDDVIQIRFVNADEDEYSSVWFIRIVEAVSFFGFTLPK